MCTFLGKIPESSAVYISTSHAQVGARYSGPLKYSVSWPGSSSSAPVSIVAKGTMTLTAILDREADALLTLVVTAEPLDTPELAVTTIVDIEVRRGWGSTRSRYVLHK